MIHAFGRHRRAHRVSYELAYGPIPEGLLVCHRCDNPPCVRPDHLFLGTNLDNMRDARAKGRNVHGETHPTAKLTLADVLEIRRAYAAREMDTYELAEKYGVRNPAISRIVRGDRWGHAPGPLQTVHHPMRQGERGSQAKLTLEAVRQIRQQHEQGLSYKRIGKLHGVSFSTVADIIKGRTWSECA
jgi:hypothetical protein